MSEFQPLADAIDASRAPDDVVSDLQPFVSSLIVGEDVMAPREAAPESSMDLRQHVSNAIEATWIHPEDLVGQDFDEESGYDGTAPENQALIPKDFDTGQMEDVMEALSSEERDYLIQEFQTRNALLDEMAQEGLSGLGVTLAVAMLDPTAIAATLATGAAASPWIFAAKGTRASVITSRMLRSGAVAAGTEGGLSAMRLSSDVNYDAEDAALDIALAATFGTALGWMGRPIKDAVHARTVDKTDAAIRESGKGGDDAGAMKVTDEEDVAFQKYRVDSLASLAKHGNNEATRVGKELLEDAIDPTNHTAALQAHTDRLHYTTKFNGEVQSSFRSWQKAQGFGRLNRLMSPVEDVRMQEAFAKQVFRQLEIGDVDDSNVQAAASLLTKQRNEIAQKAGASELHGFQGELDANNKITHKWDFTAVAKAVEEDEQGFIDLVFDGLKAGARKYKRTEGMDADEIAGHEAYLKAMAIGFSKRAHRVTTGGDMDLDDVLVGNVDAGKFLRETLKPEDVLRLAKGDDLAALEAMRKAGKSQGEILDSAVRKILAKALKTKGQTGGGNTIDRGKLRMDLDLSVKNDKTGLIDMFDNNALRLHHQYIRNVTGWKALADNVKSRNLKGPQDWEKMMDDVKRSEFDRISKSGSKEDVDQSFKKVRDRLENARKEIFGENVYDVPDNTFWKSMDIMRRYNFTTSMGQAAISAITEMARVFAEGGIKNTLRNVPELKQVLKASFSQGKGKTLAAEANTFGASFGDEHLMTALSGFDGEHLYKVGTYTKMGKADIVSQKTQRAMAQASLLAPVDRVMRQFGFSVRHTALYRHFKHGEKLNFKPESLGLSKKDMDELKDAFLSHTKEGKLGGVEKAGIEHWDPKIRHKYLLAATRADARQVQKMIAGQDIQWMQHPAARVFMQFRSFVANSYTKHFLADTHAILKGDGRDKATALVSIGMSSILAMLAYKTRVEINAVGRADSEEYRARMLTPESIGKNAAMYTPAFGAPISAFDATIGTIKPEWAVNPYRSTGLKSTTSVGANPTTDKIDRFGALMRDLTSDEQDYYGRTAARKMGFLVPFSNTIAGAITLNLTDKSLKE